MAVDVHWWLFGGVGVDSVGMFSPEGVWLMGNHCINEAGGSQDGLFGVALAAAF